MRIINYLILFLIVLFSSCGNSPSDASEANNSDIGKSDYSVKEIAKSKPVDSALHKVWTTFQKAVEQGVDCLIVHHGLFWDPMHSITGKVYDKIKYLIKSYS